MSIEEINKIFAENLRKYMNRNGETQAELAEILGVTPQAVSTWMVGIRTPRMGVVDKMCEHYGIKRSDLLDTSHRQEEYYTDENTRKMAQEIFESKELRGLFYAAKDLSPDKLRLVQQLCKQLRENDNS